MGATVTISGVDQAVLRALQTRIDAALAVSAEVPRIIKDRVALDNEDVDGGQLNPKQPRPKRNPRNFPNLACVDKGNLFDQDRWRSDRISATQVDVVYSPPDYFVPLITKDPNHGGRKWILPDRINANAAAEIQQKMNDAFNKVGE